MSRPPRTPVPLPAVWWGPSGAPPSRSRSIVDLLVERVLDAELAALLWLLVEARLPVIVVGPAGAGRTTLLTALLDFLPSGTLAIPLAGAAEDFAWLPEAGELGWRHERPSGPAAGGSAARAEPGWRGASPASTMMLVTELADRPPDGTWGPRARIAIRALALGYGMAATMTGQGLDDVMRGLGSPPVSADEDELSRLGLVLALKVADPAGEAPAAGVGRPGAAPIEPGAEERAPAASTAPVARRRVVAAHYVRPVVRDVHGHVQRRPPAVLAAWEPRGDRLEHFAWGIVDELAGRCGLPPVEFEREQARRASRLAALAAAGVTDPAEVRAAIDESRAPGSERPH